MDHVKINFSSLMKDHWSEQEQKNVSLIADFVQQLMNNHDYDYLREHYGDHPYIQHNHSIPDSMNGLIDYVSTFTKQFPEYSYDVKKIMADGDYVTFHSHATLKKKHRGNAKKGMNIIDIWRIENGQIREHWDAIQPLDFFMRLYVLFIGGKRGNNNGTFS